MLNARDPKIINGPQVLDKYVGESEANIRKLFAEAEEEEKRVRAHIYMGVWGVSTTQCHIVMLSFLLSKTTHLLAPYRYKRYIIWNLRYVLYRF